METTVVEFETVSRQQVGCDLFSIINRLVADATPRCVRNHSFLINNISKTESLLMSNEDALPVLRQLFSCIATHSSESCVRINGSAKNGMITIQFHDHCGTPVLTLASCLRNVQENIEAIGGYLGVTSQGSHDATIVVSFPA